MHITRFETFLTNAGLRNYLFIRLHTDTGLTVLNKSTVGQFLKNSRFQGGSSAQQYLPRPSGAISQPPATTST